MTTRCALRWRPTPTPADLDRCESYPRAAAEALLRRLFDALLVTDDRGIARCASTPRGRGMTFSDRELFKAVQQSHAFGVGSYVASRLTPSTVMPMGVPILRDGQFLGMCSLGLSLRSVRRAARRAAVGRRGRRGAGRSRRRAARRRPARGRGAAGGVAGLSAAIAARQPSFSDYGQNGSAYDFSIRPLAGGTLFAVGAIPFDRRLLRAAARLG